MRVAGYRNINYISKKIAELDGIENYIKVTSRTTVRNYKKILEEYIDKNYKDLKERMKLKSLINNKIKSNKNEKFIINSFDKIIEEIENNTNKMNTFTQDDFYFLINMILIDLKSSIKKTLTNEHIIFNPINNVINVKIIQENKTVYEFILLRKNELFKKVLNTILINNQGFKNAFKLSFPQIVKIQLKRLNKEIELDTKTIKDYIKSEYVQGVIDVNNWWKLYFLGKRRLGNILELKKIKYKKGNQWKKIECC